ncbi:hypothetical protein EON64_01625 [archaeon]|nr:MAG: hypothetical protein EON64_01625 [archaeon]
MERKRRKYATTDLTQMFTENGIVERIRVHFMDLKKGGVLNISLSLFDDYDLHSHPLETWLKYVDVAIADGGLPARALHLQDTADDMIVSWKPCKVLGGNVAKCTFDIMFGIKDSGNASDIGVITREALFVCFDAEDPDLYCHRLKRAMDLKDTTTAGVALSLYVDCMPVDNLKPLDSEQVNRILSIALNMEKLRQNPLLDTSSLLQQYNLNHMRTMNQMILVNLLKKQSKQMKMVKAVSHVCTPFVPFMSIPSSFIQRNSGSVLTCSRNG